jgi:hypothetical protein
MYRDLWTGLIPTLAVTSVVTALGVILGWSNGTLGWAIVGAMAVVATIWGLTRPRQREH